MENNLDLSWADGLFLADEAYKLLYHCQHQMLTPQFPLTLTAARATSLSHHTTAVVITFTPDLISLPKVRQETSLPSRSRPPDALDVPSTSPTTLQPLSAFTGAVNSILPPALDPLPFAGSPLSSYTPRASLPHVNDAGHNRSTGVTA